VHPPRISLTSIGRWSVRRPWRALGLWLGIVVACVALGAATGTRTLSNGAVGESARGYATLDREGVRLPVRELAYIHGRAGAPGVATAAAGVRRRFAALGLKPAARVSADGRDAVVTATVDGSGALARVASAVTAAQRAHPRLQIVQTGDVSTARARRHVVARDLHRVELLAIPVTLLVLLLAFGALVAAILPVIVGLTAVVAGFGLLGPLSRLFPVQDSAKTVMLLIGLAVGVDYALFYVVRARQERRAGASSEAAVLTAVRTSGRTAAVSGATVAIAVAGMFIARASVLSGIAAGTVAVVACAVAASATALPALLVVLGPRADRGRIPLLPDMLSGRASAFWPALVDRVLRRPWWSAAAATALLLALAAPALSLRLAKPSDLALTAHDAPALRALAAVRRAFPGAGEPALVVARFPASQRAAAAREIGRLRALALRAGIAHRPAGIAANAGRTAAALVLPLAGDGANRASRDAIDTLRRRLVPVTLARVPGVRTAVTGQPAEDVDFTRQIDTSLPYVIAFVLLLAFGLLLVAFRSVVVPVKAVVLNLLSVGASYGVLALVFEHRWAQPLLGFTSDGTIVAWLPLFLFVILFGLSMDYHVFILSRVREAVDRGQSTDEALRTSIGATAGVVTAAAIVMVCVFALFGTLSSLDLKQAGVGLAAAVLIDATVIRGVLLPASMALLGERNWYLPQRLARLPLARLEPEVSEAPASP
jgi:putative drug exporter of the RND superfamily